MLTKWYPPSIKPKRVGIYMTIDQFTFEIDGKIWFQYWTGKRWKLRSDTINGAHKLKDYESQHQHVYWRGLKK